tara:strand:+ start:751 stop:1449 length:699 start_codon:yes stop_codon:yes gene_type:complete
MNDDHFKNSQVKIENLVSTVDFEKIEADEKDPDENEINTMIEDVWVDFSNNLSVSKAKLEGVIKDEVNERLRQYLKQNSAHISGAVEKHLKQVDDGRLPGASEKITSLSMLTFERKEFMKSMDKVRLAFRIELRNTKQLAVIKSRKMFLQMFDDLKRLFKDEYFLVVEQYNKIRYQMWKLENKIQVTEEQNEYLEFLNAEKDAFYDINPMRFIPLVEEFQSDNNNVTQDEVS